MSSSLNSPPHSPQLNENRPRRTFSAQQGPYMRPFSGSQLPRSRSVQQPAHLTCGE